MKTKSVLVLILLMCAVSAPGWARVIRVPQDAPTIDGATYLAYNGDEIIVSPGVYPGQIPDHGRSLNIHSSDPTNWDVVNATIIDGGGPISGQSGVIMSSTYGVTCRLAGFTIRNCGASGVSGGSRTSIIEYCHILDNWGGMPYYKGPFVISDDRSYGGGIYGFSGTIQNCIIERNYAEVGGGMDSCPGTIQNNIIARNRLVDYGGRGARGAAMSGCNGIVRNNTIVDNAIGGRGATDDSYLWRGGGLYGCGGEITNNIIWVSRTDLEPDWGNNSVPRFSCIKGWKGGGEGNIATDPRLVNASFDETPGGDHVWAAQDWRLRPDSPCIDTGMITPGLTTDFTGKPNARGKVWHTQGTLGDGSHTDMGAFEFDPGPFTLWVPKENEPGLAGQKVEVRWAMASGSSVTSFRLQLGRSATALASLGQFPAPAGHDCYETAGTIQLTLPTGLSRGTDYFLRGLVVPTNEFLADSPPFSILGTSAAAPGWADYK